jgi:hypothetical protein
MYRQSVDDEDDGFFEQALAWFRDNPLLLAWPEDEDEDDRRKRLDGLN